MNKIEFIFTSVNLYSGDLNNGLVQYLNGRKQSDLGMVSYSDHHMNNRQFVSYSGAI